LWNAARFAQMNGAVPDPEFDPSGARLTINRWILAEFSRTAEAVTESLEKYRFNEAAGAAYKFVWNTFCDWYVELLKPVFNGDDEEAKSESRACAAHVIDEICKLLHPFIPFMTEELWAEMAAAAPRGQLLCHAAWPVPDSVDEDAAAEINWLIELVSEIQRLGRVDPVEIALHTPPNSAQIVIGEATACLPLTGIVDFEAESARLKKEIARLEGEIKRLDGKLSNEKFVANAPEEVVESEREKLSDYQAQLDRVRIAAGRIAAG
jgi:valyl-tRNA synthetase